jgi:hypothetical protein
MAAAAVTDRDLNVNGNRRMLRVGLSRPIVV